MFDRYEIFREVMNLMDNHCEVTFATTENYCRDIEIRGNDDGHEIVLRVTLHEEDKNA